MLQFITDNNSDLPVAEQVKQAVEGGCRWIQLSTDGIDEESQRNVAEQVIPLCKPDDVFLTIEHNVELVDELKVHGVHLFPGDMLPKEARDRLGAHAVIGVTVINPEQIISLKHADIDYVQVGPYPTVSLQDYANIVSVITQAGVNIPVVATGIIRPDDVPSILATGVKGIAVNVSPADSCNIVESVKKYLSC